MTYFSPLKKRGPLRCVVVGAGGMGRTWVSKLMKSSQVELVGIVDMNRDAALSAVESFGIEGCLVGQSLEDVIHAGIDMVVNVTIPEAHLEVSTDAMRRGIPVLSEKPVGPTVAQAIRLAASAEAYETLLMVSQSRRYFNSVVAIVENLGHIGELGIVTNSFSKAVKFGGFREEMDHPLLVDMAIHPFDLARHLIGGQPRSVYCEDFNPSWSWYAGSASASAIFEFSNGVRFVYNGSWCSKGAETSWNGQWRLSGAEGTLEWDGDHDPVLSRPDQDARKVSPGQKGPEEIEGALAEFVAALHSGSTPFGEVHRNVSSLAMVEAAIRSSETKSRVDMDDVLNAALEQALAEETDSRVQAVMRAWDSPWDAVWS